MKHWIACAAATTLWLTKGNLETSPQGCKPGVQAKSKRPKRAPRAKNSKGVDPRKKQA